MFIDQRLHLIIREIIYLPYFLSRLNVLAKHHVKQTQLAIDLRTHFKLVFPLANKQHIAAHIHEVIFHLIHLDRPIK